MRQLIKWSLPAALVVAIGVGGYGLGTLNPAVHESAGTAYSNGGNQSVGGVVLTAQASVQVDGWWYGIDGAVMAWEDAGGGWHDAGWPSCLSTLGDHQIRFGWVPISSQGVLEGQREVVWVECP